MAERPYFYIVNGTIRKKNSEFDWYGGFAVSQKQKCIASFHEQIKKDGRKPLEVSTKSTEELGKKLSAFNLKLDGHLLECVFQSSKVFEKGGPYADLLAMPPKEAKRDERLKTSGKLTAFRYQKMEWPLLPKTVFYDYIYYQAVRNVLSEEELQEFVQYDAFTDIEFNPNKSINTQARSAAIAALLYRQDHKLKDLTPEEFLEMHKMVVKG